MHFMGEMKPTFKFLFFFVICPPLRTRSVSASLRKGMSPDVTSSEKQAVNVRVGMRAGYWRLQDGKESTNKVGA